MGNEAGTNHFAEQEAKIRCDCLHTVLQVVIQLDAILSKGDDLVAEIGDVFNVLLADLLSVYC